MERTLREAIARIDVVQDGKVLSRGTGTLVAPGVVLTALHVVADRRSDPPQPYPGAIQLTFPGHQTAATIRPGALNAAADWVLLDCQSPPPAAPVPLGRLRQSGVDWETYGFPDANPRDGMAQSGRVANWEGELEGQPAFQLFSEEAAAGDGAPVKGLSGAPVIVDGWLVGHMRFALMQEGRTVAGTLYACPVPTVAAAVPALPVGDVAIRRSTTATILGQMAVGERRTRVMVLAGVLLVAAALAGGYAILRPRPVQARPAISRLGLMPFRNLTGDTGKLAALGSGMREVILHEIRRIHAIQVVDLDHMPIALTGSGTVRGPDLEKLGVRVDAVLQGEYERVGSGLTMRVELVQSIGTSGRWVRLWRGDYDIHGSTAFAVQHEVAQRVAGALEATISAGDSVRLAVAHTNDSAAAEFLLLGRDLLSRSFFDGAAAMRASVLLDRAVREDPGLALGYARLSDAHSLIYFLGVDQSRMRDSLARGAADTAMALAPGLPEGRLARALYHYRVSNAQYLALREADAAMVQMPGDPSVLLLRGLILRRLDRWQEAACALSRASYLSPGDWVAAYYAGQTFLLLSVFDSAAHYLDRSIADSLEYGGEPQRVRAYLGRAMLHLAENGDTAAARARLLQAVADLGPGVVLGGLSTDEFRFLVPVLLTPKLDSLLTAVTTRIPTDSIDLMQVRAMSREAVGDRRLALIYYLAAEAAARARMRQDTMLVNARIDLAMVLAGLGRLSEAVRTGEAGLALLERGGRVAGSRTVAAMTARTAVARIYLQAGRVAPALGLVERLFLDEGFLTPAWVAADPAFAALRPDPRYHALERRFAQRPSSARLPRSAVCTPP